MLYQVLLISINIMCLTARIYSFPWVLIVKSAMPERKCVQGTSINKIWFYICLFLFFFAPSSLFFFLIEKDSFFGNKFAFLIESDQTQVVF